MRSYSCCTTSTKTSDNIEEIAKILKLLGEPNRLRILCVLNSDNEHCVCEFADHMPDLSQSLLSHHLADLKEAGLVTAEKRGLRVYYSMTDSGIHAMNHILRLIMEDKK